MTARLKAPVARRLASLSTAALATTTLLVAPSTGGSAGAMPPHAPSAVLQLAVATTAVPASAPVAPRVARVATSRPMARKATAVRATKHVVVPRPRKVTTPKSPAKTAPPAVKSVQGTTTAAPTNPVRTATSTATYAAPIPKSVSSIVAKPSYGVPSGTVLRVHQGDLTITKPGTVIDRMDIRGYVNIKADNVTITRSIVRGGAAATSGNRALIAAWWKFKNLKVSDTTLAATNYSLNVDGLSGSNFTATRLDISRVVDTVKVIGPNVTLENSRLHNPFHSDADPNQKDGRTHDDSVQIEGGTNIVIRGNVMQNAHNAAIQITQNYSATTNARLENNQFSGGACTINVTQFGLGTPLSGIKITGNSFMPGSYGTTCPMRLPKTSSFTLSGNVWSNLATKSGTAQPNWF